MSGNTYITRALRLNNALQFVESFSEPANNMYFMFAGRHLPWSNDTRPPRSDESVGSLVVDAHDQMMYGKNISPSDVTISTRKIMWVSNTVYSAYTDNVRDLFDTNFYVVSQDGTSYKVYKCIDNNGGIPSTSQPVVTVATDNDYATADGYRWKWLFTISESDWNKFNTSSNIPVIPNSNVSGNAVSGALDCIKVTSGGAQYNSYHEGSLQVVSVGGNALLHTIETTAASNADFYSTSAIQIMSGAASGQIRKIVDYFVNGSVKTVQIDSAFSPTPAVSDLYEISPLVTITGDGTGATARAIVNTSSNSISRVEIVDRGQGYTWANTVITANTGVIGNTFPTPAVITTVISPPGGHGANVYSELGATAVTLSVNFDASVSSNNIIEQNDIRTFGVIQDVLFANVSVAISSVVGTFVVGETLSQDNTLTTGTITSANSTVLRVTNVRGFFESSDTVRGATSNATATAGAITSPGVYYNAMTELLVDMLTPGSFTLDELITQGSNARGYVHSTVLVSGATYRVRLTNVRGVFNATDDANDLQQLIIGATSTLEASVTDIKLSDIVRGSGTVLFTDNTTPITKANNQQETVRLSLEF